MSKKVEMPLRKPANLPHPRLPAPTGPNFKGLSPHFLLYKNGSNLTYRQLNTISINTKRPHKIHFKVISLRTDMSYDPKFSLTYMEWHATIIGCLLIMLIRCTQFLQFFLFQFTAPPKKMSYNLIFTKKYFKFALSSIINLLDHL